MKILIAEDNVFFLNLLGQVLGSDHELLVTRDGNEAWDVLQRPTGPRLAILDWVMPGLSGPEICRRVRASAPLSSIYLIIFTAKNNTAEIVSGLRAGADDYITKPPVPEELRARVAVGERVLALQDALETQTALAQQAAVREKRFRDGLLPRPFCAASPVQENLRQVAAYLRRSVEPAGYMDASSDDLGIGYLLAPALENSHS